MTDWDSQYEIITLSLPKCIGDRAQEIRPNETREIALEDYIKCRIAIIVDDQWRVRPEIS